MGSLPILSAAGTPPFTLEFASNVASLLTAIKSIGTTRANIGYHGMSIIAGFGSDGSVGPWNSVWRTLSVAPKLGVALTAALGGAQAYGVELVSLSPATLSGFYTVSGTSLFQFTAAGIGGSVLSVPGGGAAQVAFTVSGARAGQTVRLHCYCNTVGMTPRYAISGANTVAQSNLPITTSAAPTPLGTRWWYDTDIVLTNAGTSTVTVYASATSTHDLTMFGVDIDVRTDAGITIHRLAQSSAGVTNAMAAALDNTDTAPAGNWIGSGSATTRATQTQSMTTRMGLDGVICSFDVNEPAPSVQYPSILDVVRHYTNYANAMAAIPLKVIFVAGISIRNPIASASSNYTQNQVINAIRSVAGASNNCALLDLTRSWSGATMQGKYYAEIANLNNWIASEAPTYVHPSAAGHIMFANLISSGLVAALP